MTDESRLFLKMIGLLLTYPDERFKELLQAVEEGLHELAPGDVRNRLLSATLRLKDMEPLVLQEEYTRLFDFNSGTSLHLTHHAWGDAKERGGALARLNRWYAENGLETATRELPDYLPLVLEFVSVAPESAGRRVVEEYRDELGGLASRVADASKTYAGIMELLPGLVPG